MEKRPERRWQSVHDLRIELERIGEERSLELSQPGVGASETSRPPRWSMSLLLVFAALAASSVGSWLVFRDKEPVPRGSAPSTRRYTLSLPPDLPFFEYSGRSNSALALSPDGTRLAYETPFENGVRLAAYRFDTQEFSVIEGSEGATKPRFSPDGDWLVFFRPTKLTLEKLPFDGGNPVLLTPALYPFEFQWRDDGFIYFTGGGEDNGGLQRVPEDGGEVELVSRLAQGGQFLPAAEALFFDRVGPNVRDVFVWKPTDQEPRPLMEDAWLVAATSSGHLLTVAGDRLSVTPVDTDELLLAGPSVDVTETGMSSLQERGQMALTQNGLLVYPPIDWNFTVSASHEVVVVDRQGNEESLGLIVPGYDWIRLSDDGSRVGYPQWNFSEGDQDVWIFDVDRRTKTRFTLDPAIEGLPLFSPDGTQLAFTRRADGIWNNNHIKDLEGSGEARWLVPREVHDGPVAFSSDGRWLTLFEYAGEGGQGVMLVDLQEGSVEPLLQTRYAETGGELSPDDSWIAYSSDKSGRIDAYVASFPDVDRVELQISVDGGQWPVWNPRGGEIFYSRGGSLFVVPIETDGDLVIGQPRELFSGPYKLDLGFDVFPDGERFLILKRRTREPVYELQVVENWFTELERLAPTGR